MRLLLVCSLSIFTQSVIGQLRPEIDLEQFAEKRFQVQDLDLDYESLYESLLMHYTSPVNLNRADRNDLNSLGLLNPAQLNAFFQYRDQYGELLSLYELQAIPGYDEALINLLRPFVTVTPKTDPRTLIQRIFQEENNYMLLRYTRNLEKQKGFRQEDTHRFPGDASQIYGRFRVSNPNDFSIGFTFEKDAGEQFIWNTSKDRYGFDFYSGHLMLENQGIFKTLVIGDYQLQFGQGLVFGSGFQSGKGAETTKSVMRNNLGIRPYSSSLESGFFRGVASTIRIKRFESTLFISGNTQDARLVSDSSYSAFDEFVQSIQSTGYHRTPGELSAKNRLRELSGGMGLTYSINRNLTFGVTGLHTRYSSPIHKKPTNYNQFEFSGKENWISSIFSTYNWQNAMLFGEASVSKSGGKGVVAGFMSSLSAQVDFSWVVRHYERNFHSFYGNGFGENNRNINEKGMYWGLSYRPSRRYELAAYFDRFSFPWLKYRIEAPSDGYEYLVRATYHPHKSVGIYGQFREERKERTEPDFNLNRLIITLKRNYLINLDYPVSRHFELKTRIQGSTYQELNSRSIGFALVQDVNFKLWKIKLSTRFAVFDTEDYVVRQYLYERDVLYSFSIPSYSGTGTRSYVLMQYNLTKKIRLYLRYAKFKRIKDVNVNTRLTQIHIDTQTQLKLMLKLSL